MKSPSGSTLDHPPVVGGHSQMSVGSVGVPWSQQLGANCVLMQIA